MVSKFQRSRSPAKKNKLPQFKNLAIGEAEEIKQGSFHHISLPIESESGRNLSEILSYIQKSIQSLRNLAEKLKLRSVSIAKASRIAYIDWKEI